MNFCSSPRGLCRNCTNQIGPSHGLDRSSTRTPRPSPQSGPVPGPPPPIVPTLCESTICRWDYLDWKDLQLFLIWIVKIIRFDPLVHHHHFCFGRQFFPHRVHVQHVAGTCLCRWVQFKNHWNRDCTGHFYLCHVRVECRFENCWEERRWGQSGQIIQSSNYLSFQ